MNNCSYRTMGRGGSGLDSSLRGLLPLLFLAAGLHAQTCAHTVTRTPNGAVLVYQNGTLLQLGTGYTSAAAAGTSMPTISPTLYSPNDSFEVVFSRAVPLSFVSNGQTVNYWGYQTWQETWICATGNRTVPPPVPMQCLPGIVDFSLLNTTAAATLEVQIIGALSGDFRIHHVMVAEHSQFVGLSDLTVSMGRPGTNDSELTGALVPLGLSSGDDGNSWVGRPIPPQLTGTYSVVVNFSTAGLLTSLTAGSLRWEVCGFMAPSVTTAQATGVGVFPPKGGNPGYGLILLPDGSWCSVLPRVASLQVCQGAGPGYDCAGLYQASVIRSDGSTLNIVGPSYTPAQSDKVVWVPVQ
jgi:hypothetical protein